VNEIDRILQGQGKLDTEKVGRSEEKLRKKLSCNIKRKHVGMGGGGTGGVHIM
jgi:hypothetical protein